MRASTLLLLVGLGLATTASPALAQRAAAEPGEGRTLLAAGKEAFAQGRFDDAAKLFERAYAADKTLVLALYNRAFALRKAGKLEEARTAYLAYVSTSPDDNDGLFGLAETERMLAHDEEARRLFEEYLRRESRAEKAKYRDYAAAKVKELAPKAAAPSSTPGGSASAEDLAARAESAYQAERLDEAASLWGEAYTLAPTRAEYLYRRALALRKANNLVEAEAAYRLYRTRVPDDLDGVFGLAETLRLAGRGDEARTLFGDYVAKERRDSRAKYLEYAKKQIEALKGAGPSPEKVARAQALFDEGLKLHGQGRYDDAAARFAAAYVEDPTRVDAVYRRALALRKANKLDDARQGYLAYLARRPGDPDGTYGLAETERLRDDVTAARASFQRYIEVETRASEAKYVERARQYLRETEGQSATTTPAASPGHRHVHGPEFTNRMTAKGLVEHGEQELQAGDTKKALSHATLALALDAENARAMMLKGAALEAEGDVDEARLAYEKVLAMAKDDPALVAQATARREAASSVASRPAGVSIERVARANEKLRAARALLAKNATDDALAELAAAVKENPGLVEAHLLAGDIYLSRKSAVAALASFERALAASPERAAPHFGLAQAYEALGETRVARHHYGLYARSTASDVDDTKRRDAWLKVEGAL